MTAHLLQSELESLTAMDAARRLLGCELVREINGKTARVKIVETEAYDQQDAASHSYKSETKRTEVMFGKAGRLYVYFTYGMHYCCNIVTGREGYGAAVLVRAVEPLEGEEVMLDQRPKRGHELSNGPAKLCQALQINKTMNGHDLSSSPFQLILTPPLDEISVVRTRRIGISQAKDQLRRFYISKNSYVSKPNDFERHA